MVTSVSKTKLRKHRKEHSLCIFCGASSIPGQTRCQKCADRAKANCKKYAVRDEAKGICKNIGCSNKVTSPHKYCDSCNKKATIRSSKSWFKRVSAGLCGDCGILTPLPGRRRCKPCNIKATTSITARRKLSGLCTRCGNIAPEIGYSTCRACLDAGSKWHLEQKLKILDTYGGRFCIGCGDTRVEVLQLDHINGGGNQHAKEIGGRARMYAWMKKNNYPPGFRVLCANCNVLAHRGKLIITVPDFVI